MVKRIAMPKYGLQQDEGTVIRWHKKEGERVAKGEVLLELETDKAVFEYESPEAGFVRKILAQEGAAVPVLSIIALLTDTLEESFDAEVSAERQTREVRPEGSTGEVGPSREDVAAGPEDRVKSSPAARKLAKDLGVDLSMVKGTGPGGRITREDVERATSQAAVSKPSEGRTPLSRMRLAIGRAMSQSKATVPHFYVSAQVDMTDAEAWRRGVKGVRLSVTDLIVKSAAVTLAGYPALNASLDGDSMVAHGSVNVGLAVGTEHGLLVPVIAAAQSKSLTQLAAERVEAVEAARQGKLRGAAQATFTISNLGMFGVTSFIAIVNPPESAALAVGAILAQLRPVGEPLTIAVRQVMEVTLSADHRLADGMLAAQYLQEFKGNLENAEKLKTWL